MRVVVVGMWKKESEKEVHNDAFTFVKGRNQEVGKATSLRFRLLAWVAMCLRLSFGLLCC
jgi:hypothetical protein